MSAQPDQFALLSIVLHENAIELAQHIKFDKTKKVHFAAIVHYCSVLEQSQAILALIDAGSGSHTHSILRGQVETFANLLLLLRDESYVDQVEFDYLAHRNEILVSGVSGNRILKALTEAIDADSEIKLNGTKLKELKKKGLGYKTISEKLRLIGMDAEVGSILPMLNHHSHNGLHALERRHIRKLDSEDFEIVCFSEPEEDEVDLITITSLGIVLLSSQRIHEFFDTSYSTEFHELRKQYGFIEE